MTAKAFSILAEFRNRQLEAAYGRWGLPGKRLGVYFCTTLVSVLSLCFIPNDFRLHGLGTTFYWLLLLRSWQVALGVAVSLLLRKHDSEKLYQYLVFLFWLSTLLSIFMVNTTRPGSYTINFFIDIIAVFFSYIMMPNRLPFQLAPALLFSFLSQYFFIYNNDAPDIAVPRVIIASFVTVNIVGIIWSWRMNYERRNRYLALTDLQHTNKQLERALAEIKTLQGIVPICAKCKKIRDDKGYWNQLEDYMETRLDAEFSHGLCPDCMRELYPELADKVLERQTQKISPKH